MFQSYSTFSRIFFKKKKAKVQDRGVARCENKGWESRSTRCRVHGIGLGGFVVGLWGYNTTHVNNSIKR